MMESIKSLGIGINVYNPTDDEDHLERIMSCITSLHTSCHTNEIRHKIVILLNKSEGMGNKTERTIREFCMFTGITSIDWHGKNSLCECYNHLFTYLYNQTNCDYITVFADDYVVPTDWAKTVMENFEMAIDFQMPLTTYVPQQKLKQDIEPMKHWKDGVWGIYAGVTQEDVDEITESIARSSDCFLSYIPKTDWCNTNSVETTVFRREVFTKIGFLNTKYTYMLFNWDFYKRALKEFGGYISNNNFVFHYGKGGTKAVHKETADEKYSGSTAEKDLQRDIDVWNAENNDNLQPWW